MKGDDERLTTKSRVDLSRLPPCRDSLSAHIHSVNHRLALYKRADEPLIEKPNPFDESQGWEKTDDGMIEPIWFYGPVLPPTLIDLLESTVFELEQGHDDHEGLCEEMFEDDDD